MPHWSPVCLHYSLFTPWWTAQKRRGLVAEIPLLRICPSERFMKACDIAAPAWCVICFPILLSGCKSAAIGRLRPFADRCEWWLTYVVSGLRTLSSSERRYLGHGLVRALPNTGLRACGRDPCQRCGRTTLLSVRNKITTLATMHPYRAGSSLTPHELVSMSLDSPWSSSSPWSFTSSLIFCALSRSRSAKESAS